MNLYTIPTMEQMHEIMDRVPSYMFPSSSPWCIVGEGVLSAGGCDAILEELMLEEPYKFSHCDANTREAKRPLSHIFQAVEEFTLQANRSCWRFSLDHNPCAWLQSYMAGDAYQIHMDGELGQTRKLTTVVMLTDPSMYEGGELRIVPYPNVRVIPKTRGTMVTFPAWLYHEVLPIKRGFRQSLNLGYFGPHWK